MSQPIDPNAQQPDFKAKRELSPELLGSQLFGAREIWNDRGDVSLSFTADRGVEIRLHAGRDGDQILRVGITPRERVKLSEDIIAQLSSCVLSASSVPERLLAQLEESINERSRQDIKIDLHYAVKNHAEVRDSATGFRTKAAILDDAFVSALNRRFPDGMSVSYFDFNHMKLVNQFGRSAQIDQFMRDLPSVVDKVFGKLDDFEVIRLGGDEFLIFTGRDLASKKANENFKQALSNLRDNMFPPSDPIVASIERVAALREEERRLRDKYWDLHPANGSLDDFREWLVENHIREEQHRKTLQDNPFRVEQTQFLVAMLNIFRLENPITGLVSPRMPILSASSASMQVSDKIGVEGMLGIISALGKEVSASKRSQSTPKNVSEFDRETHRPSNEQLSEYESYRAQVQRFKDNERALDRAQSLSELGKTLGMIRRLEAKDAAVPDLFRYGLIRERKVGEILQIDRPGMASAFFFDIRGFASLNNVLGSDIGDQALRKIAEVAKKRLPDGAKVRFGGGGMIVIIPTALDQEVIKQSITDCLTEMNQYLDQEFNHDVRVLAEYLEKQTVDNYALSQKRSLEQLTSKLISEMRDQSHRDEQSVPEDEGRVDSAMPHSITLIPKRLCVEADVIYVQADPEQSGEQMFNRLSFLRGRRERATTRSQPRKSAA